MSRIGTWLFTTLKGEAVGEDEFGNRYYQERGVAEGRWRRRWVFYRGAAEASRVPPGWNAWLHRTIAEPPSRAPLETRAWEREHQPNLTGTGRAWLPKGHLLRGGRRAPARGDYEAWRPEEESGTPS